MAANMWKNNLKNVESDNNKILYDTLLDFVSQQNGTYFLNKPRIVLTTCFGPNNPHDSTQLRNFECRWNVFY